MFNKYRTSTLLIKDKQISSLLQHTREEQVVTFQETARMEPKMKRKITCLGIHKNNYDVYITHTHGNLHQLPTKCLSLV